MGKLFQELTLVKIAQINTLSLLAKKLEEIRINQEKKRKALQEKKQKEINAARKKQEEKRQKLEEKRQKDIENARETEKKKKKEL